MTEASRIPTEPTSEEQVLLWGRLDNWQGDNLVVLPRDVVEYWLLRVPVLSCTTWGEVRAAVSPEVYREVLDAWPGTARSRTTPSTCRSPAQSPCRA